MGFSGGEQMKLFLSQLTKDLVGHDPVVRVGFLENSTCGINNDAPAPQIAFILDQGAPAANIPPRPFFRNMVRTRHMTWGKTLAQFLRANKYNKHKALMGTGLVMGEQLQLEITQTVDPPNAPSTIAGKGFDKPLENSKNMKRAVAAEVDGDRQLANGVV